jgi:hypothetical protein
MLAASARVRTIGQRASPAGRTRTFWAGPRTRRAAASPRPCSNTSPYPPRPESAPSPPTRRTPSCADRTRTSHSSRSARACRWRARRKPPTARGRRWGTWRAPGADCRAAAPKFGLPKCEHEPTGAARQRTEKMLGKGHGPHRGVRLAVLRHPGPRRQLPAPRVSVRFAQGRANLELEELRPGNGRALAGLVPERDEGPGDEQRRVGVHRVHALAQHDGHLRRRGLVRAPQRLLHCAQRVRAGPGVRGVLCRRQRKPGHARAHAPFRSWRPRR